MHNIINQFIRIYNDDGRNDKNFDVEERRLRWAQDNLKIATEQLLRKSQILHDLVVSMRPPNQVNERH